MLHLIVANDPDAEGPPALSDLVADAALVAWGEGATLVGPGDLGGAEAAVAALYEGDARFMCPDEIPIAQVTIERSRHRGLGKLTPLISGHDWLKLTAENRQDAVAKIAAWLRGRVDAGQSPDERRKLRVRRGDTLGQWHLERRLGAGGNGEVWLAVREPDQAAAVKVLRSFDPTSERFKRFRREVEVQKELTEVAFRGVLPVLDLDIPDQPSPEHPAWFSMPRAERLREVLGTAPPVDDVLRAMAEVADVLARLHERRLAHRDVKPENLFRLDGDWVVGDLGLIDHPDAAPLTAGAKALGPRHYLAPEMLDNPSDADGAAADVYSLAKTLWVLLTGQNYPVPGPHRIDDTGMSLRSWISHPRVNEVDLLVERATRLDAAARPGAKEVCAELRAALQGDRTTPGAPEFAELASRIGAITEPGRRREEANEEFRRLVNQTFMKLKDSALSPAYHALAHGLPGFRSWYMQGTVALHELMPVTAVYSQDGWMGLFTQQGERLPVSARLAVGLRVREDETESLVGILSVEAAGRPEKARRVIWRGTYDVPVGSAQAINAIQEIAQEFMNHLPDVLASVEQLLAGATPEAQS